VHLLVFVLHFDCFLLFSELGAFEIPGGDNLFASTAVFGSNDWQLKVIIFVYFYILGPVSDGGSGQSFLISKLINKRINVLLNVITFGEWRCFSYN
jgi:hypothetical protein